MNEAAAAIKARIDKLDAERNEQVELRSKHDKRQRELSKEIHKLTQEMLTEVMKPASPDYMEPLNPPPKKK